MSHIRQITVKKAEEEMPEEECPECEAWALLDQLFGTKEDKVPVIPVM